MSAANAETLFVFVSTLGAIESQEVASRPCIKWTRADFMQQVCKGTGAFHAIFFSRVPMKNYQSFGDRYRLEHGHPYDEHEMLHEFLLISPSYRIAHQVVNGQLVEPSVIDQIPDWESVLETHKLCGDIYSTPFIEWWDTTGRDLFYTQQVDGTYVHQGPVKLQNNKINKGTLNEALCLVNDKARLQRREGKRIENWRLGVEVGLKSKWVELLQGDIKKTVSNDEARRALGALVSRKLKQALSIAENAARGKFPCDESLNSRLEFDYTNQNEITNQALSLEQRSLRKRYENGSYVQKRHLAYLKPPSKAKKQARLDQWAAKRLSDGKNDGS